MSGGSSRSGGSAEVAGGPGGLVAAPYLAQREGWPQAGRFVLASFDQRTIVVYQAYGRSIADYALGHQKFGGEFRFDRMSWLKTSFLWMMYRSGWGSKPGQERVLAVRIDREFFDGLLQTAVPSGPEHGPALAPPPAGQPRVRLQWDPDRAPRGERLARKAVQLGLRGRALRQYGERAVRQVLDMSPFVRAQRELLAAGGLERLLCPLQRVYQPACWPGPQGPS